MQASAEDSTEEPRVFASFPLIALPRCVMYVDVPVVYAWPHVNLGLELVVVADDDVEVTVDDCLVDEHVLEVSPGQTTR